MIDIIKLLPDNISNQIAAGEVIQRPASAVKELLENSIDAGASSIKLLIEDAGKKLIQVVDNGQGMSATDARMSFERHATSKIDRAEDLFKINTMGFRGEALASIAAVAQVELITKQADSDIGSFLEIQQSVVQQQKPCAANNGTSIKLKNLFFNIPARRNFLKSNNVEIKHIVDEFFRIVLAFPSIRFSLESNGQAMFELEAGNLKQRVLQLFGPTFGSKLIPIEQPSDYVTLSGFVAKPDMARKTRGEQYFFVNRRFIRSAYLHHAVATAFGDMLVKDTYPTYVLFIEIDPSRVDINVHPTKQEIKFEDDRLIYGFIQSSIRQALSQYAIAPSIDFTLNKDIQSLDAISEPLKPSDVHKVEQTNIYKTFTEKNAAHRIEPNFKSTPQDWKSFFEPIQKPTETNDKGLSKSEAAVWNSNPPTVENEAVLVQQSSFRAAALTQKFQIHNSYIISPTKKGFILIHQQNASERVLYERLKNKITQQQPASQPLLFPQTIHLSSTDSLLLTELMEDLAALDILIEPFGANSFIVRALPHAGLDNDNETQFNFELFLEQYKQAPSNIKADRKEYLIKMMARQNALKPNTVLSKEAVDGLTEQLFSCSTPAITPDGKPTYAEFGLDYLEKIFKR